MNPTTIKDVIGDQSEERLHLQKDKRIIERDGLAHWRRFIDNDLVKVTMGVRRSGKTTFTHQLLGGRDYAFVNFDDERLASLGTEDLDRVLGALYGHYGDFENLLIDEVQNVHGWELFVNRLQRVGKRVFVTGSNANLLGMELATHLTGRAVQMEMMPFSFREYLTWNGVDAGGSSTRARARLKRSLEDYIKVGGFPEVVRNPDISGEFLPSLYSSIITKDIVARRGIRFVRTFREMATTLLSSVSTLMTYNRVKGAHGLKSVHTAKNYVDFLAEAYLLRTLDRFSPKPKEIANSPKKVYAIDTGMVNALSVSSSKDRGRLIENVAFLHLTRRRALDPLMSLFYWADYQGHEVDFVIRRAKRVEGLVQVTHASGPDEISTRETRGLIKAARLLRCRDLRIVTWDFEGELTREGRVFVCVPLWKWLLE